MDLDTCKNLHNGAKVGKRFGDSKKNPYFCKKLVHSTYEQCKNQRQKFPCVHN
jgi:hypothetical protein